MKPSDIQERLRPSWRDLFGRRADHFGVVYGEKSKLIFRQIYPWTKQPDGSLTHDSHAKFVAYLTEVEKNLGPGQTMTRLKLADFPPYKRTTEDIQPHIGTPVHSGRCALIQGGYVINMIMADPDLLREGFEMQGKQIVQTDQEGVSIGWGYLNGEFIEPGEV